MEKLKGIVNMDVTHDLSFIHLIQNASVLVQLVICFIDVMVVHIPQDVFCQAGSKAK
jgi:hypothetical protein